MIASGGSDIAARAEGEVGREGGSGGREARGGVVNPHSSAFHPHRKVAAAGRRNAIIDKSRKRRIWNRVNSHQINSFIDILHFPGSSLPTLGPIPSLPTRL